MKELVNDHVSYIFFQWLSSFYTNFIIYKDEGVKVQDWSKFENNNY